MMIETDTRGSESRRFEAQRLDALRILDILDSEPEPEFDMVTRLAADVFDAPIAAISLIDVIRQWFKSSVGLSVCETPREQAFCDYTICRDEVMVVLDATKDRRFANNPLVAGETHIRFYAGAPIRFGDVLVGSLCVIDTRPRHEFAPRDRARLILMADMVSSLMTLRKDAQVQRAMVRRYNENQQKLEMMEAAAGVGYWHVDLETQTVEWSRGVYRIHGLTPQTFHPSLTNALDCYHPDDREFVRGCVLSAANRGEGYSFEARLVRADGEIRTVFSQASVECDEAGRPLSLFGVFKDVTGQKG